MKVKSRSARVRAIATAITLAMVLSFALPAAATAPEYLAATAAYGDVVVADNNTGAPVVNDDAPVANDAPATNDDAPVVNDDAPATNDDAPVVNDDAPVTNDDAPVVNDDAPATNDDALGVDDAIAANSTGIFEFWLDFYCDVEGFVSINEFDRAFVPGTPITAGFVTGLMAEQGISLPAGFAFTVPFSVDYVICEITNFVDIMVFVTGGGLGDICDNCGEYLLGDCDCCHFEPWLEIYFFREDGTLVSGPHVTVLFETRAPITAELIKGLKSASGISAPTGYALVDPFTFAYEITHSCGNANVGILVERVGGTPPAGDSDVAGDTGKDEGGTAGTTTTDTNRRPASGPQTGEAVNYFMQIAAAAALVATFAVAGLVRTREQS